MKNNFILIIDEIQYNISFKTNENIVAVDLGNYDCGSSRTVFFITDKNEIELNAITDGFFHHSDFEIEIEEESNSKWLLSIYEDEKIIVSEDCDVSFTIERMVI